MNMEYFQKKIFFSDEPDFLLTDHVRQKNYYIQAIEVSGSGSVSEYL